MSDYQYAVRSHMQMDIEGGYYMRHINAMTREGLHSKSSIAAELAWRDMEIDKLKHDLSTCAQIPNASAAAPDSNDASMAREMYESQDDSLLLCASDLQNSAIYDNHVEMQSCLRAVADRISALAAPAQAVAAPGAPSDARHAELRKSWREGQRWQTRGDPTGQWLDTVPCWYPDQEYRRHPDDFDAAAPAPASQPVAVPAGMEPVTHLIVRSAFRASPDGQDAEGNEWLEEAQSPEEPGAFAVFTAAQVQDALKKAGAIADCADTYEQVRAKLLQKDTP